MRYFLVLAALLGMASTAVGSPRSYYSPTSYSPSSYSSYSYSSTSSSTSYSYYSCSDNSSCEDIAGSGISLFVFWIVMLICCFLCSIGFAVAACTGSLVICAECCGGSTRTATVVTTPLVQPGQNGSSAPVGQQGYQQGYAPQQGYPPQGQPVQYGQEPTIPPAGFQPAAQQAYPPQQYPPQGQPYATPPYQPVTGQPVAAEQPAYPEVTKP